VPDATVWLTSNVLPDVNVVAASIPDKVQFDATPGDVVEALTCICVDAADPRLSIVEAAGANSVPMPTVVDADGNVKFVKVKL
jgi:hypothetical protein